MVDRVGLGLHEITGKPVLAFPPEAVLTRQQVAAWLGVDVETVDRLPIRRRKLGRRTVRYLAKWVLEYLEREIV